MNNEQLDKILEYLDKIGEKIGTTSKEIWPLLVKQQYIDAYVTLVFFVLAIISFIITFNKFMKTNHSKWSYEPKEVATNVFFVASCLFLFISSVTFLMEFFDIFNVQYWALMDLLNKVR